jgi:hypothetical protein
VINSKGANNLYKKYGAKKEHDKSYKHDVKIENTNDKYSFIAVDACIEPGPKRPFNFFGRLKNVYFNFLVYLILI